MILDARKSIWESLKLCIVGKLGLFLFESEFQSDQVTLGIENNVLPLPL
jgi:hypothetical protein